jgi:hypothetical protein
MMKPIAVAALGLMLVGCQKIEANMSMAYGLLRVEPHPMHADSVRITTVASKVYLDPLGRGTPEGYRNIVNALFDDKCKDAPIIEEGRIRLTMGREDAVLRVICPAARG